jgi:hypothetical protein
MGNKMQFDNITFRVDQEIIYCTFDGDCIKDYKKIDIEELFYNGISLQSHGKYMPILIDLRPVSFSNSVKIFKFLAHNQLIRGLILSQIFLVRSRGLKVLLKFYNLNKKPYFFNKICQNPDMAIYYCNKENRMFNALDNATSI